jgi:hypothetical protein
VLPQTAAAFEYASRGWRVFSCYRIHPPGWGSKVARCDCKLAVNCPPNNSGKHPRTLHGFRDATVDAAIIRGWFARWPNSNIAIATGARSGLFVVDFDPRNGGGATLEALERDHGAFSRRAVVFTGGGGIHLYFRYPDKGAAIGSGGGVFGPGADLKGDGGYVIAPPSLHLSLKRYRWRGGVTPALLPNAPGWLLKMARERASQQRSSSVEISAIKTADHAAGQALAKLLGARDCGHYWAFSCPARPHKTPDAAMYPRANGAVFFVCYSANPCSHSQIAAAVKELLR